MRRVRIGLFIVAAVAACANTALAADRLSAPQHVEAQASGSSITLRWQAPGPDVPNAFVIEAGTAPGAADLAIINLPWSAERGLNGEFSARGVVPGVYFVRVRAVYGTQIGAPSEDVELRVESAACPLPMAPANVTARVEGRTVTLAWDRATSAIGHVIEAGTSPGAPNVAIIQMLAGSSLSVQAPPGQYFVRVRSVGQCGASEPSRELVVIVP